jgi:hypothetical protein
LRLSLCDKPMANVDGCEEDDLERIWERRRGIIMAD